MILRHQQRILYLLMAAAIVGLPVLASTDHERAFVLLCLAFGVSICAVSLVGYRPDSPDPEKLYIVGIQLTFIFVVLGLMSIFFA